MSTFPGDAGCPEAEDTAYGYTAEQDEAADKNRAILASIGVSMEELASCSATLRRLSEARDRVDWQARDLRELRKALALHLADVFGQLPQKDALDARERAKAEKNRKRERRQRQMEADRRWRENAELRASRLEQLEALEAPSVRSEATLPMESAQVSTTEALEEERALVEPSGLCIRIPDGPACNRLDTAQDGIVDGQTEEVEGYLRQHACYICKARFTERHHFYSHLCPPCASLNFAKRYQSCDLQGRVCLVTGARMKIGFQTALKLLRMGARVIATTRFPQDAWQRYAAEQDADQWRSRLEIHGVDFRFLGAVEAFCASLCEHEEWLDILVNNACQTIRRPAGYYRRLLEVEASAAFASQKTITATSPQSPQPVGEFVAAQAGDKGDSVAMSQLQVLAEDGMSASEMEQALPAGQRDVHGQQIDNRSTNSWLLKLGEVTTPEAVEVFCINTLTPFILNGRLRPLLERSQHRDRYIINVSAMEGKFYRYKQPTHPHTNMAKAALNMMTRTSGEDYARTSRIYMNSVDTGWINDENPLPTARRIATDHGFQTPIDEIDAAARILDPILEGIMQVRTDAGNASEVDVQGHCSRQRKGGGGVVCANSTDGGPKWGRFYKDYAPTEW